MGKKYLHISPRRDGWAVHREGSERASRIFPTKQEAVEYGRDLARQDGVELVIQRQDGTIQERNSYGNDPLPPRESTGIAHLLGGEPTLGVRAQSSADLIPIVRKGLKYEALGSVVRRTGLSRDLVLDTLALPPRTAARRKTERRLTAIESDRVYRLARIAARAEEVLGSMEKGREWLLRSNRALGQVTPLSLLDTDEGTRQVEAVLGRIEHGVWS